jgi:hypothetical protein
MSKDSAEDIIKIIIEMGNQFEKENARNKSISMGKEDEREKCQIQTIGKAEESWRSD